MHATILYMFIALNIGVIICDEIELDQNKSTDIAYEKDDRLLLFATLDGGLIAIDQTNGKIKWKIKDKPIVQVPIDIKDSTVPIFLPDPRDGSLYIVGNTREPIKKLPFTIPQLVSTSPCRSSDGILYTGKKKDAWFKLDPITGSKEHIIGWGSTPTCPVETSKFVYIGQTKYTLMMVDSKNPGKKWNVTFYDYTATSMSKEDISNYDLVHFASSSTGRLITLDRRRGALLWDLDLDSPVVACYLLDSDGLLAAPFTTLANNTITYLTTELLTQEGTFSQANHMKLYPTLYVGQHNYGLYALPSLVDQNVVTIAASDHGPLLLGGPYAPEMPKPYPEYPIPGQNYRVPPNFYDGDPITFQSIPNFGNHITVYTGHYNIPKYSDTRFLLPGKPDKQMRLISDESRKVPELPIKPTTQIKHPDASAPNGILGAVKNEINNVKSWISKQENKGLQLTIIILVGCIIAMFFYLQVQVREIQSMSQNGSKTSQPSSSGKNSHITAYSEELPDGMVKVGKITFHPDQLLGKGCEGTFVYRGEFDKRQVAVKRLLPECFTFADREVSLLRESDAHPNVVRYYCMEQDRMFRYIALELCQATLTEYIQGKCDALIEPLEVLRQATSGLAHLHSLDIVHRDIKPHNVLISMMDSSGRVKVMISDFGLCKKLQVGRVSFSRRSGVTGTDGWIAPEMLHGNERTTCAVDLFSLGCLYYYVLSMGAHPFGDCLRRQANIISGEYDLSGLKGTLSEINLQQPLLSALISEKPNERPPCSAVLAHPMFWSPTKVLAFFQDVSDRVEKAELDDPVLQSLECGSEDIVKVNWRAHIHEEVARDLRKYRTYRGDSVRDLLRAFRNKKHHFRELAKEAQENLGSTPEEFLNYWTSRFPLLLTHTWIAMQCVAYEQIFSQYYHSTHRYSFSNFRKQVRQFLLENPIKMPEDYVDESELEKKIWSEQVKNSPKRSEQNRQHNSPRRQQPRAAVGLYRNLATNSTNLNFDANSYNLNDGRDSVDVTSKVNVGLHKRNSGQKTSKRKGGSKRDEPLAWTVNDK